MWQRKKYCLVRNKRQLMMNLLKEKSYKINRFCQIQDVQFVIQEDQQF